YVTIREFAGEKVFAAAAFMPPGYIRTLHSAYEQLPVAPRLPLYCYAAVGWSGGKFYVAGRRIDRRVHHSIADSDLPRIDAAARAMRNQYRSNRLVEHLVCNCVFKYRCPNACNFVLGRRECPIPVSTGCNASCIGCISKQPKSSGFSSSQHRLDFVPTVKEIVEYVVPHLKTAAQPIASFGQGCEGEPLLKAPLIEEAITEIRAGTKRGVININTNAGLPGAVEGLCKAGLNSMRVSLNSAQPEYYHAYYKPKGYGFNDVMESILVAKRHKAWVSLNYLVFPGFTDFPSETAALKKLLRRTGVDMIQTRNLNIDPQWFYTVMGLKEVKERPIGMTQWIDGMRKEFPQVRLGYLNPAIKNCLR
ncbi:MAG TPA: radical SAM protein, partial [Chitinivibrionales bacterium]